MDGLVELEAAKHKRVRNGEEREPWRTRFAERRREKFDPPTVRPSY